EAQKAVKQAQKVLAEARKRERQTLREAKERVAKRRCSAPRLGLRTEPERMSPAPGAAETTTAAPTVWSAPLSVIGSQYRGPEGFFSARLTEAIRDLAEPIAVPGTGLPFLNSGSATRTRTIAMTARMPKT